MQKAAGFGFHEVAFAPLVIATGILAMEERRWTWFWAATLLLCCVKEDLIALVGLFGVRLLLLGEFRLGLAAIAISIVTVAGALTILAVLIGGFPG